MHIGCVSFHGMEKELKNLLYFILFSFFKFYNIFFIIKSMQFSSSSCMHIELDSENTPCMNKDRTLSLRSLVLEHGT